MTTKPLIFCSDFLPSQAQNLLMSLKPEGFDLIFAETPDSNLDERVERVRDADYLLCGASWVPAKVIEAAQKLKLIQKWGIGLDKLDLETATRLGIPVCNTAGGNAVAVSELTVTLMLNVNRKLCLASNALRQGKWIKWELRFGTRTLTGSTVGIVGGGNIGRLVAKRLVRGFDCRVLYYDKYRLPAERETELSMVYTPLDDLLRQADVVSLHVPLTPETRGMIGAREFSLMKPTAILINAARGPVVNEEALISALQNGTIAGAGLDVFMKEPTPADNPLLKMDNVVPTPHMAGASEDTLAGTYRHGFANIERVERGEPLPEEDLARTF